MDYFAESLKLHYEWKGKLETIPKMSITDREALSLAYTPGVAAPCLEIQKDRQKSFELTGRGNTVAVITDGSAVLGLGDIGPEAAMPVMEGKCALFKTFGGVDAVALCVAAQDVDTFVDTVSLIAGSFGGINLEDIAAPRCFEIEERLKERLNIPVFHDDQHGTAIVVLAALINAFKITGREMETARVVISGAGAAGTAIAKLLYTYGLRNIVVYDRSGIICKGDSSLSEAKARLASFTNPDKLRGEAMNAFRGADVFIGVSAPGILSGKMVELMNREAIIFAMSNPVPEIMPDEALKHGAAIVGTGRSDFPNQINNVLAFPGVFRGAFDARSSSINEAMILAAAKAIAELTGDELCAEKILPEVFDPRLSTAVALAVADAARDTGVALIR